MKNKKENLDILQDSLIYLYGYYGKDRIFGVYLYGDINRGVGDTIDDVHTKIGAIYLPTLRELCMHTPIYRDELTLDGGHVIHIIDYRAMTLDLDYRTEMPLHALVTEYYICNPRYNKIYQEVLRANVDIISRTKFNERLFALAYRGLKALANKDSADAYRVYTFCKKYDAGMPYAECIRLDDDPFAAQKMSVELTQEIEDKLHDYFVQLTTRDDKVVNNGTILLEEAIMHIMRIALINSQITKDFVEDLTNNEYVIMKEILKELDGYAGKISGSKMLKTTGISRPVYTTLLAKLKDAGIAEVENKGAGGTFIKIIDPELIFLMEEERC